MTFNANIPDLVRRLETSVPASPGDVMRLDGTFWRVCCHTLDIPARWLSDTYFLDGIQRQLDNDLIVDPPAFTSSIPAEYFTMLFGKGYTLITATHNGNGQSYAVVTNPLIVGQWHANAPTVPQAACAAFLKAICGTITEIWVDD